MSYNEALLAVDNFYRSGAFYELLNRRVGFRTESNLPNRSAELQNYLNEEIAPYLRKMGFSCVIHDNPRADAGPILVAHRNEGEHLPTVMTYGHGDVVAGYDDQWHDGITPWEITKADGVWYGRGTADNKGQHTINFAAMDVVLSVRGHLGFNVIVLIEMGEERGSPGLKDFCKNNAELFKADVFIASDGPRIAPETPTMFMGSRGVCNFTMRIDSHKGAHHSGNWGGVLTNPGVVLSHALASMIDRNGKILVEGWRNSTMPNSVRNAIAKLRMGVGENLPQINPHWGEPELTPEERVFASNTFEIRAFQTGNPSSPANAIPPNAIAFGHLRYVVGTDPTIILPMLRKHLDDHGFHDIEITPERDPMYATRLDPNHPWARWILGSLKKTSGCDIAVMPNLGGSLPNDVFADILGLPTIWIPHSYSGCSQHAPNEHILESITYEALRMMTGLWWSLGEGAIPKKV